MLMPTFRGPDDIPVKGIVVCVILLVGVGLVLTAAFSPDLPPDQRGWAAIIGLAIIVLLLGGSTKFDMPF
jgi:hypothetical protein